VFVLAIPPAELGDFALRALSVRDGDLWDAIHCWSMLDLRDVDELMFGLLAEVVRAFEGDLPDVWRWTSSLGDFLDGLSSRGLTIHSADAARSASLIESIRARMNSTQRLVEIVEAHGVHRASLERDVSQARDAILAVLDCAARVNDARPFVLVHQPL
jgi:hypothetical protein